ncbi:conjugative transposon protein TraM [Belliella aquatica]|uniref:Conjugative transposon TraM C-terminal domain-containing protein n=1 Tax=Belliella aquatica TaxID=1323734 RepID=A0ABQ1M0H4_9BACT|nr:conjugative transposon protein TraM [Belliella aquatica]MCH7406851.1 conjugative transposon protein TraM [Belliella aquatica]GGC32217.1 hypothetical protein GCM10010993_09010 [Belliella aquatica]
MENQRLKFDQKKVLLLVFPLFAVPLLLFGITLLEPAQHIEESTGLKADIPEVMLEESQANKWNTYEIALDKERKLKEEIRMDPYAQTVEEPDLSLKDSNQDILFNSELHASDQKLKAQEIALEEKLQSLIKLTSQQETMTLNQKQNPNISLPNHFDPAYELNHNIPLERASTAGDIDRLEALMEKLHNKHLEPDPELLQLEGLMDKVLALQYPDRFAPPVSEGVGEKPFFSVHTKTEALKNENEVVGEEENGFFGLGSLEQMVVPVPASFPAIIGEDKQLVSGSSIKMTLTEPVEINGLTFESGAAVHGVCQLDGERLKIKVDHIRYENHLIPVKLEVFGMDALPGVAIPGAIGRDAAKEGLGQGVQGYAPVQPGFTLEAQLASTSVETARGFLSKKTRLKKVNVKQGHPLLLVDQA